MAMKHYPPEFKAEAITLYRPRPGATIARIATDFHAWKKARQARAERVRGDAVPTEKIRAIHTEAPAYGEPPPHMGVLACYNP